MKQIRIAVVDDDRSVCVALERLLKASNMKPEVFASGSELFEAIAHSRLLDCVLLDLQMPGMSGLEVMEELTRTGVRIPVIFLTAHDGPGMRDECLSAGAIAYLCKPLDPDQLVTTILNAVP